MRQILLLLGIAILAYSVTSSKISEKKQTCQEFSQGVTFNDTQALGTWYLLHCWTGKAGAGNGCGDRNCLQFQTVNTEERKVLSDSLTKQPKDLKWDSLIMKLTIPCTISSNNTHQYYLEKLGNNGSFKTFHIKENVHRSPLRMKMVKSKYLAMMDCHEKFTFLLARELPNPKELDPEIKKMIDVFEHDA